MRLNLGILLLASSALAFPASGHAADAVSADAPIATSTNEVEGVYVFGKRLEGIGTSVSASDGVVSFAKFADRPLTRTGELVEVIPGMAATQHSGNTKANQYFLRGSWR